MSEPQVSMESTRIAKENRNSISTGKIIFFIGIGYAFISLLVTFFENTLWYPNIIYGVIIAGIGEIILVLNRINAKISADIEKRSAVR